MLFSNDSNVDDSPISDNAQERLKCIMVIFGSKAADNQSDDKAESDEKNPRNLSCPGSEVLSMQSKRIIVWDVVL
jgi:hypothetical protein